VNSLELRDARRKFPRNFVAQTQPTLQVEYAERRIEYGILFIFSLLYEYTNLEYVHIHLMYRVDQAECVIHIRVATPQEYVNSYSIRRQPPLCTVRTLEHQKRPVVPTVVLDAN